jgi:TPR repeat protein
MKKETDFMPFSKFHLLLIMSLIFGFQNITGQTPSTDSSKEWEKPNYSSLLNSIELENYEEAFEIATVLSSSGDSYAQCALASMYFYGAGTYRNYESAQELLAKSAKQGNKRAEYMMGGFGSLNKMHEFTKALTGEVDIANDTDFWNQMMISSEIKPTTFREAFRWFFLPDGKWGYRDIMYYCGIALITGQYGYQNQENGLQWIIKSAEMGYGEAVQLLNRLMESNKNSDEND